MRSTHIYRSGRCRRTSLAQLEFSCKIVGRGGSQVMGAFENFVARPPRLDCCPKAACVKELPTEQPTLSRRLRLAFSRTCPPLQMLLLLSTTADVIVIIHRCRCYCYYPPLQMLLLLSFLLLLKDVVKHQTLPDCIQLPQNLACKL